MRETEDKISPADHLVLVSLCVLVITGNTSSNSRKTQCSKYNSVWTKVSLVNCVITENNKKTLKKKITGDDKKKDKKIDWNFNKVSQKSL